jgi:uncharacterized protein (TIGR00725 family)
VAIYLPEDPDATAGDLVAFPERFGSHTNAREPDRERPRVAGVNACYVAVVGPSAASPDEVRTAEAVGRLLAAAGAVVVCGGLGGAMEAVARGAAGAGGTVVGLLPGSDRDEANSYVSVAIATGMGEMRNALVVRAADAVIAVGGAYGTLSEIAFALRTGVPVVGIGSWALDDVVDAPDPEAAVALALALATA